MRRLRRWVVCTLIGTTSVVLVAPADAQARRASAPDPAGLDDASDGADPPLPGEASDPALPGEELPGESLAAGSRENPVVIDPLALGDGVSSDIAVELYAAALRGLSQAGVYVVDPGEGAPTGPCADASCRAALASTSAAKFVLSGDVAENDRTYELTIRLHDAAGAELGEATRSCAVCSLPEVEDAVASAAAELAERILAEEEEQPQPQPVAIRSEPSGAQVYIDGALAGVTPFDEPLAPGVHRVELRKDGYLASALEVTVEDAPPRPLDVVLVRAKRELPLAALGWSAVGAGAVSLVAGVTLLVLDERPYKGQCEGADVDALGRCRYLYDTRGGGIAGVVAGVLLAGGGAALLVASRKSGGKATEQQARLRLHFKGSGLALAGRF
ncbi:MAG: PEGA domain-containing protein [Nannocystaceae bacterium]